MLHFIARKFARVSSKACTDEGHDCSRSTSMIAQLKNSSSVSAVLLDSNKSHLRHCREYILNCHVSIIDSNSLLKTRYSELCLVFTRGCYIWLHVDDCKQCIQNRFLEFFLE